MDTTLIKIKRQDDPEDLPYWEEFVVELKAGMSVITALDAIRESPSTSEGNPTSPVAWECSCLEGACGACAMVINGRVRLACRTLIEDLDEPIVLEPMSKFPVTRDLRVDRDRMFEAAQRAGLWIGVDGLHDCGPALRMSPKEQGRFAPFSACIMCGACAEGCPQVNDRSQFAGAFVFSMAMPLNSHPIGRFDSASRMDALMQRGGLPDCAGAEACEGVCPKGIRLSEAIARLGMAASMHSIRHLLWGS